MRRLARTARSGLAALLLVGNGAATAESVGENGVVVELFTSQGCVACPPADALMGRLAERPGVIALALHVDIWDYLGWADKFADPVFTERQKAYARAEGSRSIFTPQMVVGGVHRIVGTAGMELADRLSQEAALTPRVKLDLRRSDGMLEITATADPPLANAVQVDVVRYTPSQEVHIHSGENAGRTATYRNIVTVWEQVTIWDGTEPLLLHVRVDGGEPAVVIVQETGPGAILAAARAR
ncbi:MAG: DUF1223 domain-containing protein [Alkalilacustris sp.]